MKDVTPINPTKKTPKLSFVSRNLVAIVMIPTIIGMHYGWSLLQDNRALVSEEEKIELPIITGAKYVWHKLSSKEPLSK